MTATSQIVRDWKRIREILSKQMDQEEREYYLSWAPGATKNIIADFQQELGVELPASVRDTYSLFDGSNDQQVLGRGYLCSLDQSRKIREMYLSNHTQGTLIPDSDAAPPPEIKQMWWNPRWIPLLDTAGGSVFCVDLDPTEYGTMGQFIRFSIEDGPVEVLARSFSDYVGAFATDLGNGTCRFDSEKGDVRYNGA